VGTMNEARKGTAEDIGRIKALIGYRDEVGSCGKCSHQEGGWCKANEKLTGVKFEVAMCGGCNFFRAKGHE
jgi:hypothetical protein